MKALFLTHYFPPESNAPANRTYEHLREWVKEGDEVTVITNVPHHPSGIPFPGYQNAFFSEEVVDGIRVIRVWTYLTPNKGIFRRILNYATYMVMAILASIKVRSTDVIIATSPQLFTALAGYIVSILKKKPFFFELRDIWPESITSVGAINSCFFISCLERLELFLYRKAFMIISVTDSFVEYLAERGINEKKIIVIKNSVNLELFHPLVEQDKNEEKKQLGYTGKYLVSYIGTIGMAHAVDKLIDTARLLQSNDAIHFLIIGDGAEKENIVNKVKVLNLNNVSILEQKPREEIPKYYGISDVVVVPLKKEPIFTKVIPSKIFEIMASGRPILLSVDGEARTIVEEANCGLISEPENTQELENNILKLYNDPDLGIKLGNNGRSYVVENYNRRDFAYTMRDKILNKINEARYSH